MFQVYKLIFADDEALIRSSLPKMLDWGENGFELAGCCANGHDLLEMAETVRPDLVVTDINMPFVSGLEAARQIRADFPGTRIVFLTGYDDFGYAQQAVDIKAEKYMVKPVDAEGLRVMLTEVKKTLDKEYAFYSDLSMLKDFYHQHQGIMQNLLLNNMLLMGMPEEDVDERTRLLNIKWLTGNRFCVALIKRDDNRESDCDPQFTPNLANFALFNISSELLSESEAGMAVIMNDCTALIFRTEQTEEKPFGDTIEKTLGVIISTVEKHLKFPIIVGVGRICANRSGIHNSFSEASVALGYSRELGGNRIIFIEDVGLYKNNFQRFDLQIELKLVEALRACDREAMLAEVGRILDRSDFTGKGTSKLYIFDLLLSLFKESQSFEIEPREVISPGKLADLLDISNRDEIYLIITGCCENIIAGIQKRSRSKYSLYLEQAQNYIEGHYSDPELSIDVVCDFMNISASHLRSIFRKELNMAFIKYLNKVRLEAARRLIAESGLKNYEIADAVGFNAPHYFSYCFKQYFGMSPNDMRERGKR